MEQLTIKQLLDLGANVEISFYGVGNKDDVDNIMSSIGYDGQIKQEVITNEKMRYEYQVIQSTERSPVRLYITYGHIFKERKK